MKEIMIKNRFQLLKSFAIKIYHEKKIEIYRKKLEINKKFIDQNYFLLVSNYIMIT